MDTLERRSILLRKEGEGLSTAEIVKELSVQAKVSERTIYKDFETREKWQPKVLQYSDLKCAYYKNLNRLEQIYRKASDLYVNGKNGSVKAAALRIMLDTVKRIHEVHVISDILSRLEELEEKAKKGVFVP